MSPFAYAAGGQVVVMMITIYFAYTTVVAFKVAIESPCGSGSSNGSVVCYYAPDARWHEAVIGTVSLMIASALSRYLWRSRSRPAASMTN